MPEHYSSENYEVYAPDRSSNLRRKSWRPPTPGPARRHASGFSTGSSSTGLDTPQTSLISDDALLPGSRRAISRFRHASDSSEGPVSCSDTHGSCNLSGSLHNVPIEVNNDEQWKFLTTYAQLPPEQFHAFYRTSQTTGLRERRKIFHMVEATSLDPNQAEKIDRVLRDFDSQFNNNSQLVEYNTDGESVDPESDDEGLYHPGYPREDSYPETYVLDGSQERRLRLLKSYSPACLSPECTDYPREVVRSDYEYVIPDRTITRRR